METDASFDGLGAVLSQDQEQGRVVISYTSRSLRPPERNMTNYSDDCEEVPQKLSSETSETRDERERVLSSFIEGKFNPSKSPAPRTQPVRNRTIHILLTYCTVAVEITGKRGVSRALRGSLTREDKVDF